MSTTKACVVGSPVAIQKKFSERRFPCLFTAARERSPLTRKKNAAKTRVRCFRTELGDSVSRSPDARDGAAENGHLNPGCHQTTCLEIVVRVFGGRGGYTEPENRESGAQIRPNYALSSPSARFTRGARYLRCRHCLPRRTPPLRIAKEMRPTWSQFKHKFFSFFCSFQVSDENRVPQSVLAN